MAVSGAPGPIVARREGRTWAVRRIRAMGRWTAVSRLGGLWVPGAIGGRPGAHRGRFQWLAIKLHLCTLSRIA
jgi:hypothetical protein